MDKSVVVGQLLGLHGVTGALKVKSFCEPPEQIFRYQPWTLTPPGATAFTTVSQKVSGANLIARLPNFTTRELSATLQGAEISVARDLLPVLGVGDYYWSDLEGLSVIGIDGFAFGTVLRLFATGSNDVMVVQGADRERFIPYLPGQFVHSVDLAARTISVEWDPEF